MDSVYPLHMGIIDFGHKIVHRSNTGSHRGKIKLVCLLEK